MKKRQDPSASGKATAATGGRQGAVATAVAQAASYQAVERAHGVARMKVLAAGTDKTVSCERKAVRLTSFGRQFCLACVVDRPAARSG